MIKAVFFDIDGTLLSHTTMKVPESTVAALRTLRSKGIRIAVSTGRHPQELYVLPEDLLFDAYILLDGQLCLDERKEAFFAEPLHDTLQERLLAFYRSGEFPSVLISRDRLILNCTNEQSEFLSHLTNAAILGAVPREGEAFYMASVVAGAEDDRRLRECLEGFDIVRWHPYGVDVIPHGAGKVRGILKYLERTGISQEEVMAFGDSENDLEMLQFAKISVCMGNGSEAAKAASDYVTDGIDEDGLCRALQHFGLL